MMTKYFTEIIIFIISLVALGLSIAAIAQPCTDPFGSGTCQQGPEGKCPVSVIGQPCGVDAPNYYCPDRLNCQCLDDPGPSTCQPDGNSCGLGYPPCCNNLPCISGVCGGTCGELGDNCPCCDGYECSNGMCIYKQTKSTNKQKDSCEQLEDQCQRRSFAEHNVFECCHGKVCIDGRCKVPPHKQKSSNSYINDDEDYNDDSTVEPSFSKKEGWVYDKSNKECQIQKKPRHSTNKYFHTKQECISYNQNIGPNSPNPNPNSNSNSNKNTKNSPVGLIIGASSFGFIIFIVLVFFFHKKRIN